MSAVMPGLQTAAELIANSVRFLYFNRSNLAMKSTLYMMPHEDIDESGAGAGHPDLCQILMNTMLDLCEKMGVTVEQARYYDDTQGRVIGDDEDPNLAAETALLVLSKP